MRKKSEVLLPFVICLSSWKLPLDGHFLAFDPSLCLSNPFLLCFCPRFSLSGQWPSTGLVPRIRFPPSSEGSAWLEGTYYPGPAQWQTPRDGSAAALSTAGLAAPPWHAIVAMQLFNVRRDDAGLSFLAQVFPPIFKYHQYLHTSRDAKNHLVFSHHPWESELPGDSPVWSAALAATKERVEAEAWSPRVPLDEPAAVPGYPGDDVFGPELYLVELMARLEYEDARIQQSTPFLALDVEFNAVLAAADVALADMAKVLQLHSSSTVDDAMRSAATGWADSATTRLEYLWTGDRYASYLLAPRAQPTLDEASEGESMAVRTDLLEGDDLEVQRAGVKLVGGGGGKRSRPWGFEGRASRLYSPSFPSTAADPQRAPGSRNHSVPSPWRPPPRQRQLRHHDHSGSKPKLVLPSTVSPHPSPPPVPLPPGAFLPLSVVSSFWPLYVEGGSPRSRLDDLLVEIITPGLDASFDCQGDVFRLPVSGCAVPDPLPRVSLLHNLVVQRGLAVNGDVGFNRWLLNNTVALVCAASMDPFAQPPPKPPAYRFSRYFDPVSGTAFGEKQDMYGKESTLAAALVWILLHADAPNRAETPPISHDVTFALVVVELIIAFATGVGCFVFSLSLFRELSRADKEGIGSVSSMLNVRDDVEDDGQGPRQGRREGVVRDSQRRKALYGSKGDHDTEEEEEEESKDLGLAVDGSEHGENDHQRTATRRKKGAYYGPSTAPVPGRAPNRGLYQTFRSFPRMQALENDDNSTIHGTELRRVESEGDGMNGGGESGRGGGIVSALGTAAGSGLRNLGSAVKSGVSFLKFW